MHLDEHSGPRCEVEVRVVRLFHLSQILAKFLEKVISILLETKNLAERIRYPFTTFTQEIPLGWLIVQREAS